MARSRLAVALLLPEPSATEVDGLRRALGDGSRTRVAPHVTLVPPVNVSGDRLAEANAVVRAAAAASPPLTLILGPAATFWPANPVVYLTVAEPVGHPQDSGSDASSAGAPGVTSLRDALFRPPLARPVDHAFIPHVTVADSAGADRIAAAVAALSDYRAEVSVAAVHLLRQEDGRVWRPVAEFPLGGPHTVGRGGLPVDVEHTAAPAIDARWALGWRSHSFTARRSGLPVGLAVVRVQGDTAHLDHLEVAPAERGLGVATALLSRVSAQAAVDGCARLRAEPAGEELGAFLRRRGFRPEAGGAAGTVLTRPV